MRAFTCQPDFVFSGKTPSALRTPIPPSGAAPRPWPARKRSEFSRHLAGFFHRPGQLAELHRPDIAGGADQRMGIGRQRLHEVSLRIGIMRDMRVAESRFERPRRNRALPPGSLPTSSVSSADGLDPGASPTDRSEATLGGPALPLSRQRPGDLFQRSRPSFRQQSRRIDRLGHVVVHARHGGEILLASRRQAHARSAR